MPLLYVSSSLYRCVGQYQNNSALRVHVNCAIPQVLGWFVFTFWTLTSSEHLYHVHYCLFFRNSKLALPRILKSYFHVVFLKCRELSKTICKQSWNLVIFWGTKSLGACWDKFPCLSIDFWMTFSVDGCLYYNTKFLSSYLIFQISKCCVSKCHDDIIANIFKKTSKQIVRSHRHHFVQPGHCQAVLKGNFFLKQCCPCLGHSLTVSH